jgi:predicted esterase
MTPEKVEQRSFAARLECHYLLQTPAATGERTILVLALHGYGSNPEVMLRLTRPLLGPGPIIASLQAPNEFYPSSAIDSEVGYSWATKAHLQSAVRLHHEMLLHVLDETEKQFRIDAGRRILLGFSQPVGPNYRFAATYPGAIRGVIGLCGGIPKDWETGAYGRISAALLHIARREDETFPPAVTEKYPDRLRVHADDVEFHMLDGGHRFPSKAGPLVECWLNRVIP